MSSFSSECINNLQFQYFTARETFDDAQDICSSLGDGSSLVTTENFDKYEDVTKFYASTGESSDANYWIGLRALNEDAGLRDPLRFNWVNGLDSQSFFSVADQPPWREDRPNNNNNGQDCIAIRLNDQVFEDTRCSGEKAFMCQVNCGEIADTPTFNPSATPTALITATPTSNPTANPTGNPTAEEEEDDSDEEDSDEDSEDEDSEDDDSEDDDSEDEDSDEEDGDVDDNNETQGDATEEVSSILNIGLMLPLEIFFMVLLCCALCLCCLFTRAYCLGWKDEKEEKAKQEDGGNNKLQSKANLDI